MKRIIFVVVLCAIAWLGYGWVKKSYQTSQVPTAAPVHAAQIQNTAQPTNTPQPRPTATIGYQATIDVAIQSRNIAQATADSAMRLQTDATMAADRIAHENLMLTRQAENDQMLVKSWTATAMYTSVPLTQTQQVIDNDQVMRNNLLQAGQLTATAQAPELERSLQVAKNYGKIKLAEQAAFGFVGFGIIVLAGALVYVVRWNSQIRDQKVKDLEAQQEAEQAARWGKQADPESVQIQITLKLSNGTIDRDVLPISNEMLVEMADRFQMGDALNYENFRGSGTSWTQNGFTAIKRWGLRVGLITVANGKGEIRPTEEGERFLSVIHADGTTPPLYVFSDCPLPSTDYDASEADIQIGGEVVEDEEPKYQPPYIA